MPGEVETQAAPLVDIQPDVNALERAILKTVAYADVFEYPLKAGEIHRYLVGVSASADMVKELLSNGWFSPLVLQRCDEFYYLPGREAIISTREQRLQLAAGLWPQAVHYGAQISRLPFVRMVAVTGALAMDNEPGRDLDYLIVTETGRLWLCRALIILLVRRAALSGAVVCPNYFLSENALVVPQRNLYTAHELLQMVPLSGFETYWEMRRLNDWASAYLPNAAGLPRPEISRSDGRTHRAWRSLAESLLRTPPGGWLENWEMRRKLRKFRALYAFSSEADFGPDWCKGHLGEYGARTLKAFAERVNGLYD